jgi:hypothetical protein
MTTLHTTIKTRNPLSVPTDVDVAVNQLAIAIKNHVTEPSSETLAAVEAAQHAVFQVEDKYREGYMLLLEHLCAKQRRAS